jgi:hypothetical protein
MELILSQQITGRPYVAPPNVPPARLAVLRAAFEAMMVGPDFLADAHKMRLMIDPLNAQRFNALLDRAYRRRRKRLSARRCSWRAPPDIACDEQARRRCWRDLFVQPLLLVHIS